MANRCSATVAHELLVVAVSHLLHIRFAMPAMPLRPLPQEYGANKEIFPA